MAFVHRVWPFGTDQILVAFDNLIEEAGIPDYLLDNLCAWYCHKFSCKCSICAERFRPEWSPMWEEVCEYTDLLLDLSWGTSGFITLADTMRYISINHPELYENAKIYCKHTGKTVLLKQLRIH